MNSTNAFWYLYQNNNCYGPLHKKDLLKFIVKKEINGDSFILRKGEKKWQPLKTLNEFSHFLDIKEPTPPEQRPIKSEKVAPYSAKTSSAELNAPGNANGFNITNQSTPFADLDFPPSVPKYKKPATAVKDAKTLIKDLGIYSPESENNDYNLDHISLSEFYEPKKESLLYKHVSITDEHLDNSTDLDDLNPDLKADPFAGAKKLSNPDSQIPQALFAPPITPSLVLGPENPLGKSRRLLLASLFWPIIQLGFYVIFWVVSICDEIALHLKRTPHKFNPVLYSLGFFVPLIHLISAYKLGKKIEQMEKEDGYKLCNRWLAVFLWSIPFIPFFFIFYIQKSLNQHWKHHLAQFPS